MLRDLMVRRTRALAGAALAFALLAFGAPVRAADPLSYDDPGMHFKAPDGWTRVDLPPGDPNSSDKTPVAVFTFHAGKSDQRTILITVEQFSGDLDTYEHQHESDVRSQSDNAFIEEHSKATLTNGMPAYFFRVRTGDVGGGRDVERSEYLVIDTQRAIVVSFVGGVGQFSDKEIKADLSSLYVVVYPGRRRD
jgi:hypothetical protein